MVTILMWRFGVFFVEASIFKTWRGQAFHFVWDFRLDGWDGRVIPCLLFYAE